jgi:hypothetical protein
MSELTIPPLRELPPARFAQRTQHLRAEIAGGRRAGGPSPRLVAAVALVVLLGVLLATPAFGLRDHVVHFFTGDRRPPAVIVKRFENMNFAPPGGADPQVLAGKAREVMSVPVSGFGKWTVWVAPTKAGGFCTTHGRCVGDRSVPFDASLMVSGPSGEDPPQWGSPDVHVVFDGYVDIDGAANLFIRFEDGSSSRIPLVWVTPPIDAGFFVYEVPKKHWKIGARPVAFVVEDAKGKELARETKAASYFPKLQKDGFAPPDAADWHTNWLWLILVVPAVVVAAGLLLTWSRRRRVVYAAAAVLALAVGAGGLAALLTSGNGQAAPPPVPKVPPLPSALEPYSVGYVSEGFPGGAIADDQYLVARTRQDGLRWDRWTSHRRTPALADADFAHQSLVGIFLLGHRLGSATGVAVTGMKLVGGTLRVSVVISDRPVDICGAKPDDSKSCRPMYKPPSTLYHAFTAMAVEKALAARIHRVKVVHAVRDPGAIQVPGNVKP